MIISIETNEAETDCNISAIINAIDNFLPVAEILFDELVLYSLKTFQFCELLF